MPRVPEAHFGPSRFCGSTFGLLVTREHLGSVDALAILSQPRKRSGWIEFQSHDLGTFHRSPIAKLMLAKLIRGSRFCYGRRHVRAFPRTDT
jgi:hypothetical protein